MIYFDSDMFKSTNTVVYFDWKTVIYIYGIFKQICYIDKFSKSVKFLNFDAQYWSWVGGDFFDLK
jgi:hypothetical protein